MSYTIIINILRQLACYVNGTPIAPSQVCGNGSMNRGKRGETMKKLISIGVMVIRVIFVMFLFGCGGAVETAGDPPGVLPSGALLSWVAPTTYDDGSPLIVAGYKVYYGTTLDEFGRSVDVGNTETASIDNLDPGTWFFTVTAYDQNGNESGIADPVSKVI